MFKDLKLGLGLLKYGYKVKYNIAILCFFMIIGLVVEIGSKGTSPIGGFYFMLSGMFSYQLIISLDISEFIQSTAMKKKLQVNIPVIVSTVIYLVTYTFLLVERIVLIKLNPEDKEQLLFVLLTVLVFMLATYVFCSFCYKAFFVSTVCLLIIIFGAVIVLNFLWAIGLGAFLMKLGIVPLAIMGYAVVIIGGLIEYGISSVLYRYPLSEFAFRGIFKDTKM